MLKESRIGFGLVNQGLSRKRIPDTGRVLETCSYDSAPIAADADPRTATVYSIATRMAANTRKTLASSVMSERLWNASTMTWRHPGGRR